MSLIQNSQQNWDQKGGSFGEYIWRTRRKKKERKENHPSLGRKYYLNPLKAKNKVHGFACFPAIQNSR